MRHCSRASWIVVTLLLIVSYTAIATESTPTVLQAKQTLASQPTAFTKNMGQWPDSILFRADIGEAVMWVVRDGVYYQLFKRIAADEAHSNERPAMPHSSESRNPGTDSIITDMIKAQFVSANRDVQVVGLDELDYRCNYFLGDDPTKWRTDVPNYRSITMSELYPGVDASFGERYGRLECRLTAASDSGLAKVRTVYLGNGAVTEGNTNTVSIHTVFGEKRFTGMLPVDESEPTGAAILLNGSPNAGASLVYSTYLGGSSTDEGYGIAVDGSGNAHVIGYTYSTNFPTQSPYMITPDTANVIVTKFSPTGSNLIYSTYLGGSGNDYGYSIAIDEAENAYLTGRTSSTDFPTMSPFQTDPGDGTMDVFVSKLSASGNSLIYSTYLGGQSPDYGTGITVDGLGSAYIVGITSSTDYPTELAFQLDHGGAAYDAFVTKLSGSGSSLVYSTYLGGSDTDYGIGIAVGSSGNAYVTGYTYSTDFPTQSPYQTDPGDANFDVFVTKLSTTGNTLAYSTYLGGADMELAYGVAVDPSGSAYVTGATQSTDFPVFNPMQDYQGGSDCFVSKVSPAGSALEYSTYLGGTGGEEAMAIAVNSTGNAIIVGGSFSSDFPFVHPIQTWQDFTDAFAVELSTTGKSILFGTFLGGSNQDRAYSVAIDGTSGIFVTGYTSSSDFPAQSSFQTDQGGTDAFVTKLYFAPCCLPDTKLRGDVSICGGSCPNGDGTTDGSDLQAYVDLVFFNGYLDMNPDVFTESGPGVCPDIGDVDNSGGVDGGDLGIIVDFVFFGDTSVIVRCDGSPF